MVKSLGFYQSRPALQQSYGTSVWTWDTSSLRTFSTADLEIVTYKSLARHARTQFDSWVQSMTLSEDGEDGAGPNGALAWVHKHNANGNAAGIHQSYVCLYCPTQQIIATTSIVTDDRGVAEKYAIKTDGIWAFLNVRPDWRCSGIGTFLGTYLDRLCQQECNRVSQQLTFSALSSNPASVKLLAALGFEFQRKVFMDDFGCEADFFSKHYLPGRYPVMKQP